MTLPGGTKGRKTNGRFESIEKSSLSKNMSDKDGCKESFPENFGKIAAFVCILLRCPFGLFTERVDIIVNILRFW